MNEDTRAVLTDLALGVVSLVVQVRLLRELRGGFGRSEFDLRSAAIGVVETACYNYLAEHEPIVSKLEYPSGELAFFPLTLLSRRLVLKGVPWGTRRTSAAASVSFSTGSPSASFSISRRNARADGYLSCPRRFYHAFARIR